MDTDVLITEVDEQTALCNVANAVLQYTKVKRGQNGRGRCATYAADVDTIAQSARQLAEMVNERVGKEKTPDQQRLMKVEQRRKEFEAELGEYLDRPGAVRVSVTVHTAGSPDDNRPLALAALQLGWHFNHSSIRPAASRWLENHYLSPGVTVFFDRRKA